jgi:hypothetical protein
MAAALFPAPQFLLHRPTQFFVRDVQIPLRGLEIRVAQKELNRSQVQAAAQPTTGRLGIGVRKGSTATSVRNRQESSTLNVIQKLQRTATVGRMMPVAVPLSA